MNAIGLSLSLSLLAIVIALIGVANSIRQGMERIASAIDGRRGTE